mmetsp:Transcript_27372/g.82129  ORF Transcript_27372/g.82129 Transcript_27372/m.82129 type:complete len:269 (+) Transcript_27372:131-937(+)
MPKRSRATFGDSSDDDDDSSAPPEVASSLVAAAEASDSDSEEEAPKPPANEARLSLAERVKLLDARQVKAATTATSYTDLKKKQKRPAPAVPKRSSKNAPAERSSRRPDKWTDLRTLDLPKKRVSRDPRFETLSTDDGRASAKRYAFLDAKEADELRERKKLLKTKRGRKDPGLKAEVERATARRKQKEHDARQREVVAEMKRAERAKVKAGKKPFYPKKSAVRQALLDDRFDRLKKSGKLNGFLRKKARKKSVLEQGARARRGDARS